MSKLKLYFGCALTHTSVEYRQFIQDLRQSLKADFDVLEFLSDPLDMQLNDMSIIHQIYEHDVNCVKSCDIMIAECSYASTGLGFELGLAIERDKPVLAIAGKDVYVTRLVQGVTHPKFSFRRYGSTEEVTELIKEFVAKSF